MLSLLLGTSEKLGSVLWSHFPNVKVGSKKNVLIMVVYYLYGETGWFTVWTNGKQKHRMRFLNEICRVPFTRIHSERPELSWVTAYEVRNRRKAMVSTFSVQIFRPGILDYLPRRTDYFGNFPFGRTKIVLPFICQPKCPVFFGKW